MSFRSLRTGVSGLRSNQTRLDVVGNNISNANTVAFKRGRAAFSEVLGQKLLGVGRTAGGSGINPSHVGLGTSVSSIDQNWSQGSLENTGIQTDLALSGDGFFVASPKEGADSSQRMLTRAGNFTFNQNGEFVTSNGLNVQGWEFNEAGEVQTGDLKNVQLDPNAQSAADFTSEAVVGGNLSADAEGGDMTSISTVVYDEQGTAHDVVIEFTKNDGRTPADPSDDAWDYKVDATTGGTNPFQGPGDGSITFNTDGSVDAVAEGTALSWKQGFVDGGPDVSLNMDDLTQFSGSTTATVQSQNGHSAGELAGYNINPEGVLELNFTNGEQKKIAQLAVGNVNNPNGLEQQGENFYTTTGASGDLQLGRAGRDLRTSVVAGTLEASNVDLATEFTEMIVAQRGYQAAARVVTTSDEVLQETVQLKR
jgi:flagellar hook protein FlgE